MTFQKAKPLFNRLLKYRNIDKKTGCWNYTGTIDKERYGYLTIRPLAKLLGLSGYSIRVHRLSAMTFLRFSLRDSRVICHKCDNRKCFNPHHLFIATPSQNTLDMVAKKRHVIGSQQGLAKLKESDVPIIRTLLLAGKRQIDIAKQFSVSQVLISLIKRNKIWTHVQEGNVYAI